MNDHICQLMVNHLNLNNDKDFAFLLIKSIKNGSITATTRLDLQDSVNLKKSVLKRIIRLLPLTWLEIEQWPVNLENTVLQAILNKSQCLNIC